MTVRGRGGAPPWRRLYIALGWDDAGPARDGLYSERLSSQVRKRTPDQLVSALDEVEEDVARFSRSVALAEAYRARDLMPRGSHALALNELWRFVSISRGLAKVCLERPSHALDERAKAGQLQQAATHALRELDRAVAPSHFELLGRQAGGWTEPAPGLRQAVRQRRMAVMFFCVILAALLAGLALVVALD